MKKIFNKANKDIVILVFGKVLQIIIALLAVRLLTTFLSESEVGSYYLLLTLLTLFNFAFLNPVGQYYNRYVLYWKQNANLSNANAMLLLSRAFGIILSLFVATFIYFIFDYSTLFQFTHFILFIFISLIASSYLAFLNVINLIGNRLLFIKYLLLSLVLGISLSIIINLYISDTGMAWLYGIALAQLLLFLPMYNNINNFDKLNVKLLSRKISVIQCKRVMFFSFPVMITLFLQWGQNSSYRLIVEDKYTVEVLSYIAVGLAVATSIFTAVESLATQYFMPNYLNQINNGTSEERSAAWNYLASYMIPIYFLLMMYVIFTAPFLMKLLVNEKYHNEYSYVMIGASIEFFRVCSNLIYLVSQSEVKTKTTIIPYLTGFTIMICCLYYFDANDALWLIPSTLSFTYFLISAMLYFNMKKLLAIKLAFGNIIFSFLLSSFFCTLFFLNKEQNILNSILIILVFGGVFLFFSYLIFRRASFKYGERLFNLDKVDIK